MSRRLPDEPLLGLLFRLLNQQYSHDVDAALHSAGFDISPAHSSVFVFVPPEGISASDLARLMQLRKQSMAEAIEHLERAGYVERRPNPADRRSQLVFLTARGQQIGPTAVLAGRAVERAWAGRTSDEEIEALRQALTRLLTALRDDL
jgi:DNA-binding MarR family transcriptional regulator